MGFFEEARAGAGPVLAAGVNGLRPGEDSEKGIISLFGWMGIKHFEIGGTE
jgi:hypothetical protein